MTTFENGKKAGYGNGGNGGGVGATNTDHFSLTRSENLTGDWRELGVFSIDGVRPNSINFIKSCYSRAGIGGTTEIQVRGVYSGDNPLYIGDIYFLSSDTQTSTGIYGIEWVRTATPLPAIEDITIEVQARRVQGSFFNFIAFNTTWGYLE